MKTTEILMDEHEVIRQALDNMEYAVQQLETGQRPPREFFEKAIEFTRLFSDKFHHFKEEYLMFVRLAQKKNGAIDARIDSLRYQHDRGRNLIGTIDNSLGAYANGEDASTTILLESQAAFVSLLRQHIHTENHVFFPMAEKELSDDDQQYILDEFKKADSEAGGNMLEKGKKMVTEMGSLI